MTAEGIIETIKEKCEHDLKKLREAEAENSFSSLANHYREIFVNDLEILNMVSEVKYFNSGSELIPILQ